jgi:hypothetical protein
LDVLAVLVVVLGALLAGAVTALVLDLLSGREPEPEPEPVLALGEALESVDLALRLLVSSCASAGREPPDVYVVLCSDSQVTLRLAALDTHPPVPWKTDRPGEQWTIPRAGLRGVEGVRSFPLMVTLGRHGADWILTNLARPSGPIAVSGDPDDVRRLVGSLVSEIVTGPIGESAEVALVGARAAAALADRVGVRSERLWTAATLDDALARGTQTASALGVTQVYKLIQGASGQSTAPTPRVLVVDAAEFRSGATVRNGAVLVLGDVPEAAWRLAVRPDGSLDTGPLGLDLDVPSIFRRLR